MRRKFWWLVPVVLAALVGVRFVMLGSESRRMEPPARPGGGLAPCPATPNCVSSLAADEPHAVEPLPLAGDPAEALARLRAITDAFPGSGIAAVEPGYLRFEFRSPLLGFVDDLEFLVDQEAGRIEVRSASRVGYSDLGANGRRVEAIREKFEQP